MIPNNACTLRITAAAGTELAGASFAGTVKFPFFPAERALRPESLHHSRGIAGSGFLPLSKIPNCCHPWVSGPCSSSSVTDHPLRPVIRRRHGRPLPHHLADRTRTALLSLTVYTQCDATSCAHSVLTFVSKRYPQKEGTLFTRYSPVCH